MLEKRYIEGITGVETLGDTIEKIGPAVAAAGRLAVGAAGTAAPTAAVHRSLRRTTPRIGHVYIMHALV